MKKFLTILSLIICFAVIVALFWTAWRTRDKETSNYTEPPTKLELPAQPPCPGDCKG